MSVFRLHATYHYCSSIKSGISLTPLPHTLLALRGAHLPVGLLLLLHELRLVDVLPLDHLGELVPRRRLRLLRHVGDDHYVGSHDSELGQQLRQVPVVESRGLLHLDAR